MVHTPPATPRAPDGPISGRRVPRGGSALPAGGRVAMLLAAVVDACRVLLDGDDLPAAMHDAVAALGTRAEFGRVVAYACRGDVEVAPGTAWRPEAAWAAPGVSASSATRGAIPDAVVDGRALLEAHRAGRPVLAYGAEASAAPRADRIRPDALGDVRGTGRTALVPVHTAGAYWGFVRVDDGATGRAWTDGELTALAGFAAALAAAIDRARREAAAREAHAAARAVADARAADAERRGALLRGLASATRALLDAPTFEAGLHGWLATLAEAAGADRAAFATFAEVPGLEGVDAVVHLAVWARPGMPDLAGNAIPRTDDFEEVAGRVLAGEVYCAGYSELRDARSRAYWDAHGIRATTVVPVALEGGVAGWFHLDYADEHGRHDADLAVLLAASDGVGVAVRREEALRAALVERAARERAEQARAGELAEANARLARSMTRLTGEASPDAFVYQLHREMCDLLDGGATAQYEVRDGRSVGGIVVDAGAPADDPPAFPWTREERPVWRVASLREDGVHRLEFPRDAALMDEQSVAYMRAHGLTWVVRLPLFVDGALRWLLSVAGCDETRLTEPNLALFRTLAGQLTLALELRRLAETGRQAAIAEERNALAREVHDTLAQGFSGIVMQLGAARAQLGPAAAAAPALDRVERLARAHLTEARRSIAALRPGTGAGNVAGGGQRLNTRRVPAGHAPLEAALRAAVRAACDAAAGAVPGTTPDVTLAAHGLEPTIPAEVEIELLRIAQAAIANALAHANARRIAVDLAYLPTGGPAGSTATSPATPASVRISVADDGRGFDPDAPRPGRYGLDGMCERAARVGAELTLVTAPGEGTEVVVMWRVGSEGDEAGAVGHT